MVGKDKTCDGNFVDGDRTLHAGVEADSEACEVKCRSLETCAYYSHRTVDNYCQYYTALGCQGDNLVRVAPSVARKGAISAKDTIELLRGKYKISDRTGPFRTELYTSKYTGIQLKKANNYMKGCQYKDHCWDDNTPLVSGDVIAMYFTRSKRVADCAHNRRCTSQPYPPPNGAPPASGPYNVYSTSACCCG